MDSLYGLYLLKSSLSSNSKPSGKASLFQYQFNPKQKHIFFLVEWLLSENPTHGSSLELTERKMAAKLIFLLVFFLSG